MFDLDKCCQPGERITIVTKDAVIVGVIPETYHPHGDAATWAQAAIGLDPLTDRMRLHLHTHGFSGCASGVGIKVEVVRARGQD